MKLSVCRDHIAVRLALLHAEYTMKRSPQTTPETVAETIAPLTVYRGELMHVQPNSGPHNNHKYGPPAGQRMSDISGLSNIFTLSSNIDWFCKFL